MAPHYIFHSFQPKVTVKISNDYSSWSHVIKTDTSVRVLTYLGVDDNFRGQKWVKDKLTISNFDPKSWKANLNPVYTVLYCAFCQSKMFECRTFCSYIQITANVTLLISRVSVVSLPHLLHHS